jgi:hypothetical protein
MASIKLTGDTSGEITISAPAVAGTNTLTLPASTGNILTSSSDVSDLPTAPSFSARLSSNQSVSATTWTKMACATEMWDTDSKYDNTTNYRFTPTVSGYYMFSMGCRGASSTTNAIALYKNGAVYRRSIVEGMKYPRLNVLVYTSGGSDYYECYAYTTGTSFEYTEDDNWFQAHYVRS